MLDNLVFVVTQKLAVLFIAGLTAVGGVLAIAAPANPVPSSQTAIIANAAVFARLATSTAASTMPNLLPTATTPFCTASSTCGERGLRVLIHASALATKKNVISSVPVSSISNSAIAVGVATSKPTVPINPTIQSSTLITAQSFLNDTNSSVKVLLNGFDELVFTTNLANFGNQNTLTWGMLTTMVGGTGSVPAFSVNVSCDPAPTSPDPTASDQNPTFNVRTTYDCTVSLTPKSGGDRRMQTKDFSFTTPPGDFVVMPDSVMDTILVDNTNDGGIIFKNQDSNPVTVTGITFDASYDYLAIDSVGVPATLRFQDPATGKSLADYPLTNASSVNVTLPISLTIPALSQKLFPIQALGVQKMFVANTTPGVTITVTGVTLNRSDVPIVLHDPTVAWSCIVSETSYDPNATSGAYAAGQACLQ